MVDYAIASASGMVIGAVFFLALSAAVAFAVYALLTQPRFRRAGVGGGAMRASTAAMVALAIGLALFATIYFAMLTGFYSLAVGEDAVRLDYAVPARSVVLPRHDVRQVAVKPAYQSHWQLEITTSTGLLQSALGSADRIKQAAAALDSGRGHR